MRREIKYRGKALDSGEWAFGYPQYSRWAEEWYVFPPQGMTGATGVRVNPDTIGQYTGLKDAGGREIYDGDILDSKYFESAPGRIDPCEVTWLEDGWCCSTAYEMGVTLCTALSYGAKLIGNIFDNPELLEPEKTSES